MISNVKLLEKLSGYPSVYFVDTDEELKIFESKITSLNSGSITKKDFDEYIKQLKNK